MYKLEVNNFKAFGKDGIVFGSTNPDLSKLPKNILCYGDNGTGKSSVYEAIRWIFYSDKIINNRVSAALVGEERANAIKQVRLDLLNKKATSDFSLKINGVDYTTYDKSQYLVYMFTGHALRATSRIDMMELYSMAHFGGTQPASILSEEKGLDVVISDVNRVLKDVFFESIQIERSQNDEDSITLVDNAHNLRKDEEIPLFFNEAKIHLVKLLLLLSSIELTAPIDTSFHRILVLDDIFTSLDSANRIFIFQYLAEHFTKFQIILLTHNVNFFNLAEHLINNHYCATDKWIALSLYEYNDEFQVCEEGCLTIKQIKKDLRKQSKSLHYIGNDVRKYFEILLHRLAVLTMIDAKEESRILLRDIYDGIENRNFYVSANKIMNAGEVIRLIKDAIENAPSDKRLRRISDILRRYYTNNNVKALVPTLEAMTIFQKVALHKSSHGHAGLPDLTSKEIKSSLILLERLETLINKISMERV